MRETNDKTAIAKHRDDLREIFEDLETIVDGMDDGVHYLEEAIDKISEYT